MKYKTGANRKQMRTSDIAYVKNVPQVLKPAPPLEEMELRDIVRTYLVPCVKSYGKVSECAKCKSPCPAGIQAVQLAFEGVKPKEITPGNPLNRTMIELAKKYNEERRKEEQQIATQEEKPKPKKRPELWTEWFPEAIEQDDPVEWVMQRFNLSKNKAKRKIWNVEQHNPEAKQMVKEVRGGKRFGEKVSSSADGKKQYLKGRHETAFKQDDPVAWVAETFNLTEEKAKAKTGRVRSCLKNSSETKEETAVVLDETKEEEKKPVVVSKESEPAEKSALLQPLENKINILMNEQEEYKKQYEYYLKRYEETKIKVDALYEALNILNE